MFDSMSDYRLMFRWRCSLLTREVTASHCPCDHEVGRPSGMSGLLWNFMDCTIRLMSSWAEDDGVLISGRRSYNQLVFLEMRPFLSTCTFFLAQNSCLYLQRAPLRTMSLC